MPSMPFWGNPADPYYKAYFENRNYTPTQLDTMGSDPSQRSQLWDLLTGARFGDTAKMSGSYSGYLGNMGNLASQMFGLAGKLGMQQNTGGAFDSFSDYFNSLFRAPTAANPGADTIQSRSNDLLRTILAGGERARALEGTPGMDGTTPGQARSQSLGVLGDVLSLLSMRLPAEALQFIQSQGDRLYNRYSAANQGTTNASSFMQWLNQQGYVPGAV